MQLVADLHLHSKYSRAVSKNMTLPIMAKMAKVKGIDLLATGDFTHPLWIRELESQLEETKQGIYRVKSESEGALYILGTEISCIYSQGGKGRRIHILVFAPNLETVKKINEAMRNRGCNLMSDGRPIIGLSIIDLCKLLFGISEDIILIPAHVWTPWFGLLGSKSGFDSLRECCGTYAEKIYAVETGLSSDPAMNWRITEFDNRSIVSFSDAHSPDKLGRELTIFESKNKENFSYQDFKAALQKKGDWRIKETIEFYPEEGKYHVDGHAKCNIRQLPQETRSRGQMCHVCGKPLTLGVMGRVEQLASRDVEIVKKTDKQGITHYQAEQSGTNPYVMLVPLKEIIAEILEKGVNTKAVAILYDQLIDQFKSELAILREVDIKAIESVGGTKLGQAIAKVRSGDIVVEPGYDGVFGTVKIWGNGATDNTPSQSQLGLF
ncbi:DNA helicase UvrD [Candidatus Beckwithbacteria bacterium]|nr:DNA helicase UvrD [Candidatus Beckwithbacteria bacterium]